MHKQPPDPNRLIYLMGIIMAGAVGWLVWVFTVMAHR